MRFAVFATSVAALAAVPLAVTAMGPRMETDEFLNAVRCTAHANVAGLADMHAERRRLNAEARRQPAESVAQARAVVAAVSRGALGIAKASDGAILAPGAVACVGSMMAEDAADADAA